MLAAVFWDQRFTLAEAAGPSLEGALPSAAPLAALERRLVCAGGGVARLWGGLADEDAGSGCASLSEAERASDDDEMEPLRDLWRRCEGGSAAGPVWIFMLESRLVSRQECVSQAKPAVNARRMQAWLPQAGTRSGRRR